MRSFSTISGVYMFIIQQSLKPNRLHIDRVVFKLVKEICNFPLTLVLYMIAS